MKKIEVLAFDLGASNGRAIVGNFDGETIKTEEVHRFKNNFENIDGIDSWNINKLLDNLKIGFKKAKRAGYEPKSFGIDSWGVDYGLLDQEGAVLGNPRSYRGATDLAMHDVWEKIEKRDLFNRTGIAALNFNTIYQLNQRVLEDDPQLKKADKLLLMPDLLGYLLTGEKYSEYTNVTTTNLLNAASKDWDYEILQTLNIPSHLFTEIDFPGHIRGNLKAELAAELSIDQIPLIAVGTHDTASAVAAIPLKENYAFCSSGTWSLCGVETETAVLTDLVFESNFSNEGTVQGGYRPLKNIMGMWIIQECRRQWGKQYSWDEIVDKAKKAQPFRSIIDPNNQLFFTSGQMIEKIQKYCEKTNQPIPKSIGEIARTVYESLALKYRNVIETMSKVKQTTIKGLNITGGGIQNKFLNQLTADSINLPVITGPIEGAALGNMLAQLMGLGEINNISQGRSIISNSINMKTYQPNHNVDWDQAYTKFLKLLKNYN